jgi:hypothetical protein
MVRFGCGFAQLFALQSTDLRYLAFDEISFHLLFPFSCDRWLLSRR